MEPETDPETDDCFVFSSDSNCFLEPSVLDSNDQNRSESPESLQSGDWELSENAENVSDCESITGSPPAPDQDLVDCELYSGQKSQMHSSSSSSPLCCTAAMTLTLTLDTGEPELGASNWQKLGSGNRSPESSEEGGSGEAPPASVLFEISEAAEQAEKRNSGSDTDLCRPGRPRERHARLCHRESPSERRLKETKAKCKEIARLLTDAPDPQSKAALLFKKRCQRVKKYTLVSYGTGDKVDSEDQIQEETEEVSSDRYNFLATGDSESEEEYSVHHQQQSLSLTWGSVGEMEVLPETRGKGIFMFAQRRKRLDDIASEQEKMRSEGVPVIGYTCTRAQNMYHSSANQLNHVGAGHRQQNYRDDIGLTPMSPKPFVPNRTAKPFQGIQRAQTSPVISAVSPAIRRNEPRFKAPAPPVPSPHVWSPTGDIIASRDERICVPAIKAGILPESRRRTAKQSSARVSGSHPQGQGDRKSYIESEEDCFSLGAEACNFMQPRTVKLKNPPPVAPKPTIDPSSVPWLRRSPTVEPPLAPKSPISRLSHSSGGAHSQQQDRGQSQQVANRWEPIQTTATTWAPVNASSQRHLHLTSTGFNQQLPRSPVSTQAQSSDYRPHQPPASSGLKAYSLPTSVASCPPQTAKPHIQPSAALHTSPKFQASNRGVNEPGDGSTMTGKGAELFAKRQSRMEKFVVDEETVQANQRRSPSPTFSLPNSWRYSSIVRAPPPLSYNPLLSPFYHPSAAKQSPPTITKIAPKTKEKPKAPQKHLNTLDIVKHQPHHLDSSLFTCDAVPEVKTPSPKPVLKFEATKTLKQKTTSSHSPYYTPGPVAQVRAEAPAKSPVPGFKPSYSRSLPRRMNSMTWSTVSSVGAQASFVPTRRRTSVQEHVSKPLSPWEAASRSPIGSVEEAFVFQSLPSSVISHVKAAEKLKSLPEPPDEWRRRVSLDPAAVGTSPYCALPAFQAPSLSRTFAPETPPAFYGPPFKPAQPLRPPSRAGSLGYMGPGPGLTQYCHIYRS